MQTETITRVSQPERYLLTLKEIIGDKNVVPPVAPMLPVSRSTWLSGVKAGTYPSPVRLSKRRIAWRASDIENLLASF